MPLHRLATSLRAIGFACIAVQPMDPGFPWAHSLLLESVELYQVLPNPGTRFLPRKQFCISNGTRGSKWGWRRSHIYRMIMWVTVLQSGYDLLAMDADWKLLSNPLPNLQATHELLLPPNSTNRTRTVLHARPADFVAVHHDGMHRRSMNIGVVFIRSNSLTVALARSVLNRTHAAQDQQVVNEELNWRHTSVSCCSATIAHLPAVYRQPLASGCGIGGSFIKDKGTHDMKKSVVEYSTTTDCVAESKILPATRPPSRSPQKWSGGWNSLSYNQLKSASHYGRCTSLENQCGCKKMPATSDSPASHFAAALMVSAGISS